MAGALVLRTAPASLPEDFAAGKRFAHNRGMRSQKRRQKEYRGALRDIRRQPHVFGVRQKLFQPMAAAATAVGMDS